MKPPLHIREINRAREWYNPLRGLDIARVVLLLEEGERGKYDDLQKLNRMAEKRHPTLRALKHRRLSALKKLDWDIKIPSKLPAGMTARQADAQAQTLRERYEAIENLPQAIEFQALATFRGFAHLEPRHHDDDPTEPVTLLNPVPQWHWVRDSQNFDIWKYDAEAKGNETSAVAIERSHFIIREVDDPLCEIALLCFLRRNFAKKNWTAFQEDYAIPSIFAMLGENTPPDKVAEWLEIMKRVTNNSRGALPPGATVQPLDVGGLDGVQFDNFIKAEDSDLVMAGTSGQLTMLTANTGMNGDGQSDAHEETFMALAIAEAMEINAIFQKQFDKPILAAEYPSQKPVAYFHLAAEDQEDATALAERLVKLKQAGFEAEEGEVSEKMGMKLKRTTVVAPGPLNPETDPDKALTNRRPSDAMAAGNAARFMAHAEAMLSEADRADLAPVIARVAPIRAEMARLVGLDDAAFAAGMEALRPQLRALQAVLPELEKQVLASRPELEAAFTDIIGTAFLSGAVSASETRRPMLKKEAGHA